MSNPTASSPSMWGDDDQRAPSGDSRGVRGRPTISDYIYFVALGIAAFYCLHTYPEQMSWRFLCWCG